MLSSVNFLDLVKAEKRLPSDYQLAKYLEISPGLISKHRKLKFGFDYGTALKIAAALDYDPAYVILCGIIESAKCTETKAALMRLLVVAELHRNQLATGWHKNQKNQDPA